MDDAQSAGASGAGQTDVTDVVTRLAQLFGLAAGVAALVYAADGGVLALRLWLVHLPSRTIVSQLPRELLISVGLAQIVLPILAVAGCYAGWRVLRGPAGPATSLAGTWGEREWWPGRAALVAAAAIPAAIVAALTATSHNVRGGHKGLEWFVPVMFLVTLLDVLVGLNVRALLVRRYGRSAQEWSAARPVTWMTLLVGLVLVPIAVIVAGTHLPLLDAKVCTTSGSEVAGVLVGETSARTYIGQKPPRSGPLRPLLVFSIPQSEIRETILGGDGKRRPCPPANAAR